MHVYLKKLEKVILPIVYMYFTFAEVIQRDEDEFVINLVEKDVEGYIYPDTGVTEMLYNHLTKKLSDVGEYRIEKDWVPGEGYKDTVGIRVIVK